MNERTDTLVQLYLKEHTEIADRFPVVEVTRLINAILLTYYLDGEIFIFGNGGGASTAEHFASDLKMHPFVSEDKHSSDNKKRTRVHCLNESTGMLTRIANDLGYEYVFSEQLKNYTLGVNDLLIILSNSGNSPNVVKAVEYANSKNTPSVLIGGRDGGKLKDMVTISILISGESKFPGQTGANNSCFHIEDFQSSIAHMVAGILKEKLNGD